MKKVSITVMKTAFYADLAAKFENPISHACGMREGQVFVSEDGQRPENFCESAWQSVFSFVFALASGAKNFYDGWMKNPASAMISCNDGFRPVSFLLQAAT